MDVFWKVVSYVASIAVLVGGVWVLRSVDSHDPSRGMLLFIPALAIGNLWAISIEDILDYFIKSKAVHYRLRVLLSLVPVAVVVSLIFAGILDDPKNLWHSLAYVSAATCFFRLFKLKRHAEGRGANQQPKLSSSSTEEQNHRAN